MAGMDLSVLLDETRRAPLVSDLSALVDRTISEQSGITGMAIKGAAAAAKKLQADIVPVGVNRLLPNLLGSLQPHADAAAAADAEFGAYLANNVEAVTGAFSRLVTTPSLIPITPRFTASTRPYAARRPRSLNPSCRSWVRSSSATTPRSRQCGGREGVDKQ